MADQWFYLQGGQQYGPLTATQMQQLAASGHLQPHDHVWKTGMNKRVLAQSIQGLFANGHGGAGQEAMRAGAPAARGAVAEDDGGGYDDEPRPRPKRKKKGGSGLVLWLCLGGGGLVLVIGVVILLLVLLGGSKVSHDNFKKLKDGMTESEVTGILGSPDDSEDAGFLKVMAWKSGNNAITTIFTNGRLTSRHWVGSDGSMEVHGGGIQGGFPGGGFPGGGFPKMPPGAFPPRRR
ncbi:MAG: GYF domain-containing protein [Gemmataceae bacterium]|nr:GYF domain-containing protein [Gemmataceae bacterium]